jgi:GNAT superfamily N-acetyltransferase
MQIEYRTYSRESDYAGQRELFRLSFPEAIGTATEGDPHYSWKFERAPDPVHSYEYVGVAADAVVGYYAAIPYRYRVDGVEMRCGMVCDVMTHPEYRGRGIFTAIGRFATAALSQEGIAFTTGYPIRPEVIPGHLKVGWEVVETMPTYVRPVSIEGLLPKPLRWMGGAVRAALGLAQFWTRPIDTKYKVEVYGRDAFLADIAVSGEYRQLLEAWASPIGNSLVKDAAFLAWRTTAPGTDYRFLTLRHSGKLVGVALVRPTQLKGIESLAILDIMVVKDHLTGCKALHWAIFELGRTMRKDVIACMASVYWARNYRFLASCYLRTPSVFSLIVKKLDPALEAEKVMAASRWHVFWIDSDDL